MIPARTTQISPQRSSFKFVPERPQDMNNRDAVWVAVYTLLSQTDEFTRSDVIDHLDSNTSPSTVERVLETMTQRNILEVEDSYPRKWHRGKWANQYLTTNTSS